MIKEDEEGMIKEEEDLHEKRRGSRRSRRKEYGSDSEEDKAKKRRKVSSPFVILYCNISLILFYRDILQRDIRVLKKGKPLMTTKTILED